MDVMEAIDRRISCRAYTGSAVEPDKVSALQEEIDRANEQGGLHFQLYGPRSDGSAITMSRQMFTGAVPLYAALAARTDNVSLEKVGYFGERLVLLATRLGLGTCWVASTYDAATTRVDLADGEALHDVVPIGYAPAKMPFKQATIRAGLRRRDKKLADLYRGPVPFDFAPAWVRAGIEAARKGPSAVNQQVVVFSQDDVDGPVRASLTSTARGVSYTDLGIAKLHFELGAASVGVGGEWGWGDGGQFVPAR